MKKMKRDERDSGSLSLVVYTHFKIDRIGTKYKLQKKECNCTPSRESSPP
jgi:hypothetical protein